MQKKQLLPKLNKPNYNNILEEVLESKDFTADTKSLLLSMLYKIEISYNDYFNVKRNAMQKGNFLEQIISTIKYCCDKITLVEPNSEQGKLLKGKFAMVEYRSITAIPTEFALLIGICKLLPLDFRAESIFEAEIQKILITGYKAEIIEVLSDFDGWTWNISKSSYYSLLYKNIEMLLGYDFIEQWQLGKINLNSAKDIIFNIYNGEKHVKLIEELTKIIAKGFITDYENKTNLYINELKDLKKEYKQIDDTTEYITNISDKKKIIAKQIREIDTILLDKAILKTKYEEENAKRPVEKKIFSINHYNRMLESKRDELLNKINELNRTIEPGYIIDKKQKLKEKITKREIIESVLNEPKSFEQLVIEFQKTFFKAWETSIERAITKKEMVDLVYLLRYYKNIKLNDNISKIPEIKKSIDLFEQKLLLKACNSEVFCNLAENVLTSVEILKQILNTNIIDLEDICILPRIKKNIIVLEVYDGEILDKTIELGKDIKVIKLKQNKKTKLFN